MKQSYHTNVKLSVHFGICDRKTLENIPKSTRCSWMNNDFSNVVGFDNMLSDEKIELIKKFLSSQTWRKAAKGLFFIYSTFISISGSREQTNEIQFSVSPPIT